MNNFRRILVRKTKSGGNIVDGIYIDGSTTDSNIKASVQPIDPHKVISLTEGRRNSKGYWLFTDTKLNDITSENPDLINIDGELYEVNMIHPWQNGVLSHHKVLMTKEVEV